MIGDLNSAMRQTRNGISVNENSLYIDTVTYISLFTLILEFTLFTMLFIPSVSAAIIF